MTLRLEGVIRDLVPYFNGFVDQAGRLVITEEGPLTLTVDTGFSGTIALPPETLDKMNLELIDFGIFRLATGEEVELPVYWGRVALGGEGFETWFIPGDSLLGMEVLCLAGSVLTVDFPKEKIELRA